MFKSQQQQQQQQQQQPEEAPPPPYTPTGAQSRQLTPSGESMPGANGSGLPTLPYGIAAAGQSQQLIPGRGTMPGGPDTIYPGSPGVPSLPPRTPRAPRAPQFRGTVGAPQLYGEGVVDMSGEEYDAAPESYFARPTGPRAPQLGCQGGEDDTSSTTTAAQDGGGKQQEQPVKTSVAGILEKDDIQSYYQAPVFPDMKGQNPLHEQQQHQQDPYYQSHQPSAPVVYRPPAAPQFSPQMDQHQQPPSISSVVNPVSPPAMGYAETPTVFSPPSTTPYPPPAVAASPALSHYPPPSTTPMFSPAAVVRPLPAVPLHQSGSVSMPVPMPMPEPSKLPTSPPVPEHTTVAPTHILQPTGAPTPAFASAPLPPPTAVPTGGPVGPGLVTHYKCKECGGLLDSEFAACTRLHTALTAYSAPQIGYSTRPDFHLDGQHPIPPAPAPQHHQHAYYPQPQQQQQHHAYYPQPQHHHPQHHHPHNPYQPPQQQHYGGYGQHYAQPTVTTTVAAHPSNNHGTDDAYYKRPLTNGLKKLFGVPAQSYRSNHQIVSPLTVAPLPVHPVHHHHMPGPQGQAHGGMAYIPLAGPPPLQHHHQQYYHQQQQQHYPSAPYPTNHHHGMMSPIAGAQQSPYAMPSGGKDGYGGAGAGLMRSVTSSQPPST